MDKKTMAETFFPLSMMDDIENFHRKFDLFPCSETPDCIPNDLSEFRILFMQEELNEYIEATKWGDIAGQADALVDLAYVVLGTAYLHNFPFQELWDEVHSVNMKKVRAKNADESKRGHQADVVKPEGWIGPQIEQILEKHGWKQS